MDNGHKKNGREMSPRDKLLEDGLKRAVRQALLRHKRLGNPICTWRNGQVVWIPPEEIPVDDPMDQKRDS
jgi:hypothetical protein